jgi:hypothetical protein
LSLINSLSEQATFSFSGRINVLNAETKQFLGSIHMIDGAIVDATYKGGDGKNSLFKILIEDMAEELPLKFVVEPELIEEGSFTYSVNDFKKEARVHYEKYLASKKLKPPGHIKLLINGVFMLQGEKVDTIEFQVLKVISDYSRVDDIYKESSLMDYEVTSALVSLRKKGALKVFQP